MRYGSVFRARMTAVGVVGAAALAVSAAGAGAASGASGSAAVSPGQTAATLPGNSVPFGTTPADTPETVSFVMKLRGEAQLEAKVESGFTPFLSVSQFAAQYGQPSANIQALQNYLSAYQISTRVYSDDVDVVATGTAGEFDSALRDSQENYDVPAVKRAAGGFSIPAQQVHAITSAPQLPVSIAQNVTAILGLTNYGDMVSNAVHTLTKYTRTQPTSTNSCLALTGLPDACNTTLNFDKNYGLRPLVAKGAEGQGQTIGIVTLAAVDPGSPEDYWTQVLGQPNGNRAIDVENIDGGPGAPSNASGSGETDLDVEQSGGIAPDAHVVVYQAPNSDSGFADAFFTAASQNIAGSVSTSWGESETIVAESVAAGEETSAYTAAFDEAFLELAAQGQSAFASSGDEAAYDASGDLGSTNLSVDTPADSPYITAAGGTTLPWSGTLVGSTSGISAPVSVRNQRAWGWDYLWQAMATTTPETLTTAAEGDVVGSGGGFSTEYAEPSYQRGVSGTGSFSAVSYLTPTDWQEFAPGFYAPTAWSFNSTPPTIGGFGSGRAVPDVSADADPFSGYLLYSASFSGAPLEGGWGGTSFIGPQMNGSTAVMESALGHRIGFWNPEMYRAATSGSSPMTPLDQRGTGNDNIYYTGTPGTVYNEATGLGVPNLAELETDFAG
jgi:kumamolisin